MNLLSLPSELQQLIYANLAVDDRVKFIMALPRQSKATIQTRPVEAERKLSVISRAVKAGRVRQVTDHMLEFLVQYPDDDPTLIDILRNFPGSLSAFRRKTSLINKIRDNTLEEGDLKGLPDYYYHYDVHKAIYNATPKTFDLLIKNVSFKDHIVDTFSLIYFNLFNHGNRSLLSHLHLDVVQKKPLEFDLSSAQLMVKRQCKTGSFLGRRFDLIMELVEFTTEELGSIWLHCIEHMEIDVALKIDSFL